jgi:FAD/FMN-containing dehydrogenase
MVIARRAEQVLSWGRCHRYDHVRLIPGTIEEAREAVRGEGRVLPFGLGRSYGDSCLNDNAVLIDTQRLDHFISFDEARGEIVCEAGVSLDAILALLATKPQADGYWFLPVVPGTKFVTVGGAIANDVHGKNHEVQGTFGCHVNWFDLARSDGQSLRCSAEENTELFAATIGGLGLTGLVTRASIRLMKVPSLMLEVEDIRLRNLDHYFQVAEESRTGWTHHAAWVDVLAEGKAAGRGIYTRSRFTTCESSKEAKSGGPRVPVEAPSWAISHPTIKLFNAVYGRKLFGEMRRTECTPYGPIFFPLDGIGDWNKMYGRGGFYQYQCVVPKERAHQATAALLRAIAEDGQGSFLTVLKEFGDVASPGLLSFPMLGTTLAVDFPNRGERTLKLLDRLDGITLDAGGRVYAAKDGRASPEMLVQGFPKLETFRRYVDPAFSSTFWRRTAGTR